MTPSIVRYALWNLLIIPEKLSKTSNYEHFRGKKNADSAAHHHELSTNLDQHTLQKSII